MVSRLTMLKWEENTNDEKSLNLVVGISTLCLHSFIRRIHLAI